MPLDDRKTLLLLSAWRRKMRAERQRDIAEITNWFIDEVFKLRSELAAETARLRTELDFAVGEAARQRRLREIETALHVERELGQWLQ